MMINTGWVPGYLQQTGMQLSRSRTGGNKNPKNDNDGCFWGCIVILFVLALLLIVVLL